MIAITGHQVTQPDHALLVRFGMYDLESAQPPTRLVAEAGEYTVAREEKILAKKIRKSGEPQFLRPHHCHRQKAESFVGVDLQSMWHQWSENGFRKSKRHRYYPFKSCDDRKWMAFQIFKERHRRTPANALRLSRKPPRPFRKLLRRRSHAFLPRRCLVRWRICGGLRSSRRFLHNLAVLPDNHRKASGNFPAAASRILSSMR